MYLCYFWRITCSLISFSTILLMYALYAPDLMSLTIPHERSVYVLVYMQFWYNRKISKKYCHVEEMTCSCWLIFLENSTSLVNIASITCLRFYRFSRVQLSMHLFQWHVSAHAYAVLQHRLPGALPIVNSTDFCFDKQTSRVPDLCKCTYHASITICCHKASTAT